MIVEEIAEILNQARESSSPATEPEVVRVLEACIGKNLRANPSLGPVTELIRQAFLATPLDLNRIRLALRSVADHACILLNDMTATSSPDSSRASARRLRHCRPPRSPETSLKL